MEKFKIFGQNVKIEKKIDSANQAGRYHTFKVMLGRKAEYYSFDSLRGHWLPGESKFFKGEEFPLSQKEKNEFSEFVRLRLLFEAYEFTLSSRRNFQISTETHKYSAKEFMGEDHSYDDFDYLVEIRIGSLDSLWESKSNLNLLLQVPGHITNEGGNKPLQPYYKVDDGPSSTGYIHLRVDATPESLKRRLGVDNAEGKLEEDSNSGIALWYFYHKVLPGYFTSAFLLR